MLVGAMFTIKPINGVLRPTIATLLPKLEGKTGILVDVGLNADCKPEQLNQFAILGNLYAKHILNIENPKVGLLNMGEEEGKGNLLAQTTYPILKENTHIQFMGNVEGRDLFNDKADVIVCDGFTGNIILKTAEAMYDAAAHQNLQNDSFFGRFSFGLFSSSKNSALLFFGIVMLASFQSSIPLIAYISSFAFLPLDLLATVTPKVFFRKVFKRRTIVFLSVSSSISYAFQSLLS
jgi:hypothetical protein